MSLSAVIGALRVNLSANAAQFIKGLAGAEEGLKRAGKRMQSVGTTMSAAVTAPIVGLGALTLRTAGNFEASMTRVEAALSAPADVMAQLGDAAREMGRNTQFSASEAADAIEILAKNGLSAAQILGGALDASLKLAAASGADLASAGDLATDVMLNFGKEAGDLGKVVDGVAGVMLASKFGFDDYRLALAQAGGVAGGLGVELEDFNAAIAATSAAFASGSDAGTSFKTFLQRLVPASGPAADAMERLGLVFHNADGSMKSMAEVAQELQDKMSGLSEEDLSESMTAIFGTDAMRTAIGLMKAGGDGIEELSARIAAASATEQAEARMKGFNGAMKRLTSAFEALQLAIADSGLLDFVTDLVEGLTSLVAQASEADPKLLKFGTVFAALAAAVGPALVALGLAAGAVAAIGAPVALAVAGIAALTAVVVAFGPEIEEFYRVAKEKFAAVVHLLKVLVDEALESCAEVPGKFVDLGAAIVDGLWQGIKWNWSSVTEGLNTFATGLVDGVKGVLGIHSPSRVFAEIGRFLM
ncbi:MAG: phage tail tape measure protein, partial [Pseudomonadota bacterium]|nr:phage tail tape measure protein [Pseudomonadota bacterium]